MARWGARITTVVAVLIAGGGFLLVGGYLFDEAQAHTYESAPRCGEGMFGPFVPSSCVWVQWGKVTGVTGSVGSSGPPRARVRLDFYPVDSDEWVTPASGQEDWTATSPGTQVQGVFFYWTQDDYSLVAIKRGDVTWRTDAYPYHPPQWRLSAGLLIGLLGISFFFWGRTIRKGEVKTLRRLMAS
jgi:hypothetical protein